MVLLASSTYRYQPVDEKDAALRARIREIAMTRVRYGLWRVHTLLRREGWMVNHKRVYRLYKLEALNLRSKRTAQKSRCHAVASAIEALAVGGWLTNLDLDADDALDANADYLRMIVENDVRRIDGVKRDTDGVRH